MTEIEVQEDGVFLFPLRDSGYESETILYGEVLFDQNGLGLSIHRQKPEGELKSGYSHVDPSQRMCTVYIEFFEGKIKMQLYDEVGEQHDNIHYVCSAEQEHEESIVLIENVENWKPDTEEGEAV